jgi:hypothetical protein
LDVILYEMILVFEYFQDIMSRHCVHTCIDIQILFRNTLGALRIRMKS